MNAILKFILPKILEHLYGISKRFKAIMDYVHKPNELDVEVESLKKTIHELKEENAMVLTRVSSQSDRMIAVEKILKKIKKLK